MGNVFSLGDRRAALEAKKGNVIANKVSYVYLNTIRAAIRAGDTATCFINKFAEQTGLEGPEVEDWLNVEENLLRLVVASSGQMSRYVLAFRGHVIFSSMDCILNSGEKFKDDDDEFASPIILASFGLDPMGDDSVFSSVSVSARLVSLDGEITDFLTPKISQHPLAECTDGEVNLQHVPTITPTVKDSMVYAIPLVNQALHEFMLDACACSGGMTYKFDDGEHRFSYLEAVTGTQVIDWQFYLSASVYTVKII